jgi:hypothetical protein
MGSVPAQFPFDRHSTQVLDAEHSVSGGVHSLTSEVVHSTHAPLAAHTLPMGQLSLHATHSTPLQIGVVPLQFVLVVQATQVGSAARVCQTPPSHSSAVPITHRSAPSWHTHEPVAESHTGVGFMQATVFQALPVHTWCAPPAVQRSSATSHWHAPSTQRGKSALVQLAFVRHWTHSPSSQ